MHIAVTGMELSSSSSSIQSSNLSFKSPASARLKKEPGTSLLNNHRRSGTMNKKGMSNKHCASTNAILKS